MKERRAEYLRADLQSKWATWTLLAGTLLFLIEGASMGSWRVIVGGTALTAGVVLAIAYFRARSRAATDFFSELAPQLGLTYSPRGHWVEITPLLAAGDRRRYDHALEGPLFGQAGGGPCMLAHYTYERQHQVGTAAGYVNELAEDASVYQPHRFTVCAVDVGSPLWRFRGLYLQPRKSGIGLSHNWLSRAPQFEQVELESVRFNEIYDLRRANDQDESAVRELFSPSLVAWLAEHPLQPGFECKAGTLVVYIHGHADSVGGITMLHEATREIARRLAHQLEESGGVAYFSAAERA
jgi:hypothetical protein